MREYAIYETPPMLAALERDGFALMRSAISHGIVAARFILVHPQLGPVFFSLERGEYIQGLLARSGGQRRVYVVTVAAPAEHAREWPQWPRIVRAARSDTPR